MRVVRKGRKRKCDGDVWAVRDVTGERWLQLEDREEEAEGREQQRWVFT